MGRTSFWGAAFFFAGVHFGDAESQGIWRDAGFDVGDARLGAGSSVGVVFTVLGDDLGAKDAGDV